MFSVKNFFSKFTEKNFNEKLHFLGSVRSQKYDETFYFYFYHFL